MKFQRHVLFGFFSLFLLAAGFSTVRALIAFSLELSTKQASHIVVIPVVTCALIWLDRKNIFRDVQWSLAPGIATIALGILLWFGSSIVSAHIAASSYLSFLTFRLIVLWLGGFLLLYGSTAFRAALFPLLFLILAIPIPDMLVDRLIELLRSGSTEMAYGLFRASGTPIYRDGFFFTMPGGLRIEVAPECSGIRSGIALFICSLIAGRLFLRSAWSRGALVLIAIPVLLFKNALRIVVLTLLAVHVDKSILEGQLHQEGGIPFFILGLFLMYPILACLVKSERRTKLATSAKPLEAFK